MSDKIRLSDIAHHAGVSTATVSRVLNGKTSVAAPTRQAVLTALDLLGYERPEKLRLRPGGLVGLIVPELTNPIFPAIVQQIEKELTGNGYTPLLCTQSAGGTTEDQYVSMLIDQHVSGIIFVSGLHADTTADIGRYLSLRDFGIPFVFVNGWNEALPVPDFSTDDEMAIALAVKHLAMLGHSKIGLAIGPQRFRTTQMKTAGFKKGLAEHCPGSTPHIMNTLFTVEGGQSAAAELLKAGVSGIVCGSDIMALGAIREIQKQGLKVPDDVSVVGFDDSALMTFTDPPLTTLRQPIDSMAQSAVTTLVSMISGGHPPKVPMTFQAELVTRDSTARSPQ